MIFSVSSHSYVRYDMELEHLLASMMDMDRRFSLSAGISRQEILLIISKKHWHRDALSLLASLKMLVNKSMRDNSWILLIWGYEGVLFSQKSKCCRSKPSVLHSSEPMNLVNWLFFILTPAISILETPTSCWSKSLSPRRLDRHVPRAILPSSPGWSVEEFKRGGSR